MNAALYRHARAHANALLLLGQMKEYLWLIDYDLKVFDGERSYVLRPDIAGLDRTSKDVKIALEVSDSTRAYDLSEKKALYAAAAIEWYIVLDCKDEKILVHKNIGRILQETEEHQFGCLIAAWQDL